MTSIDRFVTYGYPPLFAALFALWAALAAAALPAVLARLRPLVSRRRALSLAAVCAAALAARLVLVPAGPRNLYDELEHRNIAENVRRSGALAESLAGGFSDLDVLTPAYWPGGYHCLAAYAVPLLGGGERGHQRLNALFGAAALPVVFALACLLWRSSAAGLAAAVLLALLPLHLRYSACSDLSASSFLFVSAAWLALAGAGPWTAAAGLALAAHFRPENVLLLPLVLLSGPGRAARAAFVLAASTPALAVLLRARLTALPGYGESPAASLGALLWHVPENLLWLAGPASAGLALAAAAVLASRGGRLPPESRPRARALAAWSGALFLAVCAFKTARFSDGLHDRYALPLFLPLVVLASGAVLAERRAAGACAAAFGALCLFAYPGLGRSHPAELERRRFLERASAALPEGVPVLTFMPAAVLSTSGAPSVSLRLLQDGGLLAELERRGRAGRLVLFEDFWAPMRREEFERRKAELARRYTTTTLVEERSGSGERLAFDLLTLKGGRG